MNLLLDTHAYLWAYGDKDKLSKTALQSLSDPENQLYLSVVSIWEIQIKVQLGKLKLDEDLDQMLNDDERINDLKFIDIGRDHAVNIITLPPVHKDPFDRMLISQASIEDMTIVTVDPKFNGYGIKLLW